MSNSSDFDVRKEGEKRREEKRRGDEGRPNALLAKWV